MSKAREFSDEGLRTLQTTLETTLISFLAETAATFRGDNRRRFEAVLLTVISEPIPFATEDDIPDVSWPFWRLWSWFKRTHRRQRKADKTRPDGSRLTHGV